MNRTRRIGRYFLSGALALLLLYLAFKGVDLDRVVEEALHANYWWIAASLVVLLLAHVARAWRWRYLLRPIKPDIGMRNLISGVMVGYMVNNVLPRVGELVRPYALGKLEQVSKTAAFGTIVVERLIDTVCFVLLVALAPLLYAGPLREEFPWLSGAGILISALTGVILVLLVTMMVRRDWTDAILGLFRPVVPPRALRFLKERAHLFLDGLLFVKKPGALLLIACQSAMIWMLYGLMTYLAFLAFGFGESLGFKSAVVVLAIQSIGIAVPTPGGTGSYHAFTSQALIGLFGISSAVALSYATVTHAAGFVVVTLIGLYFFLKDNIRIVGIDRPNEEGTT